MHVLNHMYLCTSLTHLQLYELTVQLVHLLRLGGHLDVQLRRRLVNQVYSGVYRYVDI